MLKKTSAHKFGLAVKAVLAGLASTAGIVLHAVWQLLALIVKSNSETSNTDHLGSEHVENGYGDNGYGFGYHIAGLPVLEDDEGNPL